MQQKVKVQMPKVKQRVYDDLYARLESKEEGLLIQVGEAER